MMSSLGLIQDIIECPICGAPPTKKPVYMCKNGCCPVCKDCKPKSENKCPKCREVGLEQSPFAGRLVENVIWESMIRCPNTILGCRTELLGKHVEDHKRKCGHREVLCVGSHRSYCNVSLPLAIIPNHFKAKKCASFLGPMESGPGAIKYGILLKSPTEQSHETIYKTNGFVSWIPQMLWCPQSAPFKVFITVDRQSTGVWLITPWTYSHKEAARKLHITIIAAGARQGSDVKFVMHGGVNIFTDPIESRKLQPFCLVLIDNNIRSLENPPQKGVFKLAVSLRIQKDFLSYCSDYQVRRGCRDIDNTRAYNSHLYRSLPLHDW